MAALAPMVEFGVNFHHLSWKKCVRYYSQQSTVHPPSCMNTLSNRGCIEREPLLHLWQPKDKSNLLWINAAAFNHVLTVIMHGSNY